MKGGSKRAERVIVRLIVILLNYKRRFVEADILLLPDPPFGTMLIFLQVPLIKCSFKFSVQSSPTWIEERCTHFCKFSKPEERDFFHLKRCHIDNMNDFKRGWIIALKVQTTYLRSRDIIM